MKHEKRPTFMTALQLYLLPILAFLISGNLSHADILDKCAELLAGDVYRHAFKEKYKGEEPTIDNNINIDV